MFAEPMGPVKGQISFGKRALKNYHKVMICNVLYLGSFGFFEIILLLIYAFFLYLGYKLVMAIIDYLKRH